MDSQELKHRGRDDVVTTEAEKKGANDRRKRESKRAMAKRGLKTLAVATLAPVLVTLFTICFLGSNNGYGLRAKPFWVPPLWALHMTCLGSAFLMGLSAWLVWADGGFHKKPSALYLYLAQIGLSLAWEPIAFKMGDGWAGLGVWSAMLAAMFGCYRVFREINPIAADLVKLCLVWAAFVAAVNVKLAMV